MPPVYFPSDLFLAEHYFVTVSRAGRYFLGTTPAITTVVGDDVVAQLVNPAGSGRNVFLTVHTLGSDVGGTFYHYFDTTPSVAVTASPHVAVANRNFADDTNVAQITYAKAATITLTGGRLAFARLVPAAGATIEAGQEGKFILRPGGNFTIYGPDLKAGVLLVGFGWWEEDIP